MKVYDVTLADCLRIAADLGVRFEGSDVSNSRGARTAGVLRPAYGKPNPYQRVSASPMAHSPVPFHPLTDTPSGERRRKVAAICWHGHRDFMREVFSVNPAARIVTGFARYDSAEHFERTYRETGHRNIGSLMYPVEACAACACPESGTVDGSPLQRLMAEAESAARDRGHRLTWEVDPSEAHASGVCDCGRFVIVDVQPAPNGVEIGGEAVALNCPSAPDTDNLKPGFRPAVY